MCGLTPLTSGDYTPGELMGYVEAGHRRDQKLASMLYTHAKLCRLAFDGRLPDLWDAFPLWTAEEIGAFHNEKLKTVLMKHAKRG